MERTRNAGRNIVFGGMLKAYQIAVPFLMRTAIIYFMGVQYLGLNSLFSSILQVLNLMELGVGSAMVYSMYEPIVRGDTVHICALLRLYRTYYRVIGGLIAAAGLLLTPFVPHLVKGDLPQELNIYVLYWMHLAVTVLSYWLFAYKNALFQAHQRTDVGSRILLFAHTCQYAAQLFVICYIRDYYAYLSISLLAQISANILTAVAAGRMYPEYRAAGSMERKEARRINARIRDLFTAKLGAVIVNSADTVVISAFLGLTALAVYQNYYFILTAVMGVVGTIFQACMAGIGNSVIMETKEKNYRDFQTFTFLTAWIAGVCTCCFLCLYQPFMKLWVGEKLMLEFPAVICFCLYYFISEINQLLNTYKDAAGIWHEDRFRPFVTAMANLCMNLLMVQRWGIYGVLLSTVLSMLFVGMPWLLHNIFSLLFERKYLEGYLAALFRYMALVLGSCVLSGLICRQIALSGLAGFILRGCVAVSVPNVLYYLAYRKRPEMKRCIRLAERMTNGRFHRLLKGEKKA